MSPELGTQVANGDAGPKKQPLPKGPCPTPTNVNIEGRIIVYAASAAYARFSGTLTDVSTGESYRITATGAGGGFAAGSFDVSGTVKGFSSLDRGFTVSFFQAGYGPISVDGAKITAPNQGSVGKIDVGSEFDLTYISPVNGAAIGFGTDKKVGSFHREKINEGTGC